MPSIMLPADSLQVGMLDLNWAKAGCVLCSSGHVLMTHHQLPRQKL